jgi:hypothetical protein
MTDQTDLPTTVQRFILRYVNSVAELEGLLLLRGDAESRWTSALLAPRLYIKDSEADRILSDLHGRGLLAREENAFVYAPVSEDVRAAVDTLADLYPRFLIPITNLIHSKPRKALREFADAFRMREDN